MSSLVAADVGLMEKEELAGVSMPFGDMRREVVSSSAKESNDSSVGERGGGSNWRLGRSFLLTVRSAELP